MGKLKKNQDGFTAIETVLVIIIVAIIAFVGWYVYKAMKNTNNAYNSANTTSNSSAPKFAKTIKKSTVATTATINITPLGISITVPKAVSDLTYGGEKHGTINGDSYTAVGISTTTLTNADPTDCSAANSPLISLTRVDGQYPSDATDDNSPGPLVKQFPSFYIAYTQNNGQIPCYTNTTADPIASTDFQDLLIPQQNSNGSIALPKINFTTQVL